MILLLNTLHSVHLYFWKRKPPAGAPAFEYLLSGTFCNPIILNTTAYLMPTLALKMLERLGLPIIPSGFPLHCANRGRPTCKCICQLLITFPDFSLALRCSPFFTGPTSAETPRGSRQAVSREAGVCVLFLTLGEHGVKVANLFYFWGSAFLLNKFKVGQSKRRQQLKPISVSAERLKPGMMRFVLPLMLRCPGVTLFADPCT